MSTTRLVLITGLSGSGKSTVAKCFEDLSFYTIDNMPLPLLRRFLEDPQRLVAGTEAFAVVTDVRAPGFAVDFPLLVADIDRTRLQPTLLFLEASEATLVRRFSETRRPHPLAGERSALEAIREERRLLAELRARADLVLDTSDRSIHDIRDDIYREFSQAPGEEPGLVVSLVTFGFKHGIPQGSDLLFDVRFLPNPHFEDALREQTGRDGPVLDFLEKQPDFAELVSRIEDLLLYLLPRYRSENRSYVSVGIGCTGGQHRSVAVGEQLEERLRSAGWPARLIHRDISR